MIRLNVVHGMMRTVVHGEGGLIVMMIINTIILENFVTVHRIRNIYFILAFLQMKLKILL